MPRLPIVDNDDGAWGGLLNSFLEVSLDNVNVDEALRGRIKPAAIDTAGGVMNTDTSTADMQFVVDEDNMASDSSSKLPTQQSVKAYVDNFSNGKVAGPASATDKAISRYDGTTGKLVQNSLVTIDNSGNINIPSGTKYKINNADLSKSDIGLGNVDNTSDATKDSATATLTNKTLTSPVINTSVSGTAIDTDSTLAANSDIKLASQKATKAYVDANKRNAFTNSNFPLLLALSRANTKRTSTDVATTNASTTVTSATGIGSDLALNAVLATVRIGFSSHDIGSVIVGTNIPNGSVITSINSATSVEMSLPATATGTGITAVLSKPARLAAVGDSEVEYAGIFTPMAQMLSTRYPGLNPHNPLDAEWGGYAAFGGSGAATTTGTNSVGRGSSNYTTTITGTQTISFSFTGDRIKLTWLGTNTGTFNINIDGTNYTSLGPVAGTRGYWVSPQLEYKSHSAVITNSSGTCRLDSRYVYTGNYETGVQTHLLGHTGMTSGEYLALSGSGTGALVPVTSTDLQDYLLQENFDFVLHQTGINDMSTATYLTKMGALLTATKTTLPRAGVGLWLAEEVSGHSYWNTIPTMQSAARTLASTYNASLIDMNELLPAHPGSFGAPDSPYQMTGDNTHYFADTADLISRATLHALVGSSSPKRQSVDATGAVPAQASTWVASTRDTGVSGDIASGRRLRISDVGSGLVGLTFYKDASSSASSFLNNNQLFLVNETASFGDIRIGTASLFGAASYQIIQMRKDSTDTYPTLSLQSLSGVSGLYLGPGGAAPTDFSIEYVGSDVAKVNTGDKLQQNRAPSVGDDLTNKTYVDTTIATSSSVVLQSKTSDYTVLAGDDVILVDATSGNVIIDIITAVGRKRTITVKKVDSSAYTVTARASGSEKIDGAATAVIASQYESITLVSDNTNYFIT